MGTRQAPPPGVELRPISGVEPTVGWLLEHEEPGSDDLVDPALFDRLRGHEPFELVWKGWRHPPNRFPMAYTDVRLVSAAFAAPLGQLRQLLPETERLTPARLTPWHGVVVCFAFDYRRGGLGAYRELGVAIPVLLDAPRTPPLLPLLADRRNAGGNPALGMYAVELPVDHERACEAGIRMYGLPKVAGEAGFELRPDGGSAWLDHEGMRMADLRVVLPGILRARRLDLSFRTFSILDERVIATSYDAVAFGYRGVRGNATFRAGAHPRFARLARLPLARRALEIRLVPRLNWVIWGPEDVGPV